MPTRSHAIDFGSLQDAALVELARDGHRGAFREIMQRGNQRLFRIARGVVHDDAEAEDVVQEAYTNAFAKLDTFRGDARLLTWLTRIVLNEAYTRLRRRRPTVDVEQAEMSSPDSNRVVPFPSRFGEEDPAVSATRAQIRELIENAVDELPESFRMVFIMRQIEECSTDETASALGIPPQTVKTRLHRARRLLRATLQDTLEATLTDAFPFMGRRCARMTRAVLERMDARLAPPREPDNH
jgi:RNA polymerase sigma-70 factor (ECF subfamily)